MNFIRVVYFVLIVLFLCPMPMYASERVYTDQDLNNYTSEPESFFDNGRNNAPTQGSSLTNEQAEQLCRDHFTSKLIDVSSIKKLPGGLGVRTYRGKWSYEKLFSIKARSVRGDMIIENYWCRIIHSNNGEMFISTQEY